MTDAQVWKGICARCRAELDVPDFADPDDDDVQLCHGCWDSKGDDFVASHYRDASQLGVYPQAGESDA